MNTVAVAASVEIAENHTNSTLRIAWRRAGSVNPAAKPSAAKADGQRRAKLS
jgi:hypothetical protein